MRILVLYQYFQSPDAPGTGRHYSFVKSWARKHEVTVVTSRSAFTQPLSERFPAAPPGAHVEAIPVNYANRMGVARRLLAYMRFAQSAVKYAKRQTRPDVIFCTSTPLSVAWAARKLGHHWNVPWVFEVRDLWPDFPIEMGAIPGSWLRQGLRNWESGLYRDADHVVTLSPDMQGHVLDRGGSHVTTLVNGTSFELLDAADESASVRLRSQPKIKDKRVILYAGSLGRANGIPIILEAARLLHDRTDVVFVFVGSGYAEDAVRSAAAELPNVVWIPPVPKWEIFGWHRLADLSLVTFIDLPVLSTNSPSKFFDSLACATPVLVTNGGWTRRFVEEHACGSWIDSLNSRLLAAEINRMLQQPDELARQGRNGAEAARDLFDRQHMADRLESIMEGLAEKSVSN